MATTRNRAITEVIFVGDCPDIYKGGNANENGVLIPKTAGSNQNRKAKITTFLPDFSSEQLRHFLRKSTTVKAQK